MEFWIDIDDTLARTDEAVLEIAADYHKNVLKKNLPEIKTLQCENHNYFIEVMGWTMEETMGFLKSCYPQCLENVQLKDGARTVLEWLQGLGHKVNILSSRVNARGEDALEVTMAWLNKNGLKPDSVSIACQNKGEYLKDRKGVFIDDAYDHTGAACANEGMTVFQINSRFVKSNPDPRIRHFSNWNELPEILRDIFPEQFDQQ